MNLWPALRRSSTRAASAPDFAITPDTDSWWPWSPLPGGDPSCPQSAVLYDALQRRIIVTGMLRSCCASKINRVFDFVMVISPGDTSMNLSGVTVLEPLVATAIRQWTDRFADRNVRLSVVDASPTVVRALAP